MMEDLTPYDEIIAHGDGEDGGIGQSPHYLGDGPAGRPFGRDLTRRARWDDQGRPMDEPHGGLDNSIVTIDDDDGTNEEWEPEAPLGEQSTTFGGPWARIRAERDAREDYRAVVDAEALDAIAAGLSGREWTPDTLDIIAGIIRNTGREVLDNG
jgi:hypothetical protein